MRLALSAGHGGTHELRDLDEEFVKAETRLGVGRDLALPAVGALPNLNRLFERMRLDEFFAGYVAQRLDARSKLPTVMNRLVLRNIFKARETIYGVGELAERYDPQFLGWLPQQVQALNDDRIVDWIGCSTPVKLRSCPR